MTIALRLIIALILFGQLVGVASASADVVIAPPPEIVARLSLSPIYTKCVMVEGLPVVGSAKVSDYGLLEAAYLIRNEIGHRPEILRAMAKNGVRFAVMAPTEMTTDIPEHSDLTPRNFGIVVRADLAQRLRDPRSVVAKKTFSVCAVIHIPQRTFCCTNLRMRFTKWDSTQLIQHSMRDCSRSMTLRTRKVYGKALMRWKIEWNTGPKVRSRGSIPTEAMTTSTGRLIREKNSRRMTRALLRC